MEDFAITSSRVSAASSILSSSTLFSQPEFHQHQVTESRSQHGQRQRRNNQHHRNRQNTGFALHRLHHSAVQLVPANLRHEACSTFLVLFSFWILACTTVILGFYGPSTIQFGPNCSRLIKPNPFFVQSIKVKELHESLPGSMLYGFSELPPLNVPVTLSEVLDVFVESNDYKEWPFFLNQGSKIHISYIVKSPSSAALSLVIAEGNESLAEWIEDPSYANNTLSWNIIHENGTIEQEIRRSAMYYIAMSNLNLDEVEVQLNYTIVAIMYNTSQAQYNCSLSHNLCTFTLYPFGSNAGVFTSPSPVRNTSNHIWSAQLFYGQRWMSYLVGVVSSSVLVLILLQILSAYQISRGHEAGFAAGGMSATERAPLLAPDDDDDLSSYDSSNDSTSHDEEYMTESLAESKLDGKQLEEKEKTDDNRRLCIICLDAHRNSFFLPCGHCAACFNCGTRIIEEAGECPTCHKAVKRVRKIFSV